MNDITKSQYRLRMQECLARLSQEQYRTSNHRIKERFFSLEQVRNAQVIMIYYSVRQEVDTVGIIGELLKQGKRVALPLCGAGCNLEAREIRSESDIGAPGRFGLREPIPGTPWIDNAAIQLNVLPGVAFDRQGHRLGHGKGYYDRFLSGVTSYKLGLAYDFQVVAELPTEGHDRGVDGLVTPSRLWRFS